jgi:hypothetical protein
MHGPGETNCNSSIVVLGTLLLHTIAPVTLSKIAIGADGSSWAPVEK